jgi:hypothetical protein
MIKKNAADSLKESIRLLEMRHIEERKILVEQFKITYESFKLANLIKGTLKDITGSVELKNNLFGTLISVVSGYLTKKVVAGPKSNGFMKILGAMMQFGITTVIAKNAEAIRNFMDNLIDRIFHPEEKKVAEPEV